jgi:hypothetical protein
MSGDDRPARPPAAAATAIEAALGSLGLAFESPRPGAYLVSLAGQHKLATMTWLIARTHSLHVEAFFCRQPDENHAEFYRFLLERSGRMYGVHFALDQVGDVYLTGRLPLGCISTAEIDRILGCVLSYSDENFDAALMLGFASSIRREWAWRTKRGESLANLQAFASLADPGELPALDGQATRPVPVPRQTPGADGPADGQADRPADGPADAR